MTRVQFLFLRHRNRETFEHPRLKQSVVGLLSRESNQATTPENPTGAVPALALAVDHHLLFSSCRRSCQRGNHTVGECRPGHIRGAWTGPTFHDVSVS